MYNKLFTKILDSSIWLAPDTTRLVWITMLASMDEEGFVGMKTPQNVANRALVPLPSAISALAELESEDPNDPDCPFKGRRLERVPDGWMVLKANEYRQIITRATRLAQTRERVRRFRARSNAVVTQANEKVTPSVSVSGSSISASRPRRQKATTTPPQAIPPTTPEAPTEKIPYQEIGRLYNGICSKLPAQKVLSESRRKAIRARWKEDPKRQNLEWWKAYFGHIQNNCPFLTGSSPSGWVADFDFVINGNRMTSIREGKYEHGKS